jgi:hexosaminidase
MHRNRVVIFILLLLQVQQLFSQSASDDILIPKPVSFQRKAGQWSLNRQTTIAVDQKNKELLGIADRLAKVLRGSTGFAFAYSDPKAVSGAITLEVNKAADAALGNEGYRLDVNAEGAVLKANTPAGVFYGVQTLLQLLPSPVLGTKLRSDVEWSLPNCSIMDYPRFGWRGLMLDVSRHFFPKKDVLRYIDDMVRYKFNLLHLHLTDDQGWRIEIKSLPKLTQIGSWRVPRVGRMYQMSPPTPEEERTYGGFYTQEEIREIVQYAKERFVNVMPEVDIPGHSMSVVAAYPELSCTPGEYKVNSGERFMNWAGSSFSALVDNTLCPSNELVYEYLDKIFTEVAALFPFEYIHMGGDECAKNFWLKSDQVKALQEREKLKDMDAVQSYFVMRVGKIISSKGKKMMGWDEILEGGLSRDAGVMSWRGEKGGIEASKSGHPVVMSPNTYCYIDFNQGEPSVEPPVYANLRLRKSYQFDPVPKGADATNVLGGQANLWTEQVPNIRAAQYMTWPRGMAIAESVWSPAEKKEWNDFSRRVQSQFERLDMTETKYARSIYDPIVTVKKMGENDVSVTLETEVEGLDIHYSFDETHPDAFYPKYSEALRIPKDAIHLKIVTCRNGRIIGRQIDLPITELKRRAGIKL